MGKRKGIDVIEALDAMQYICLWTNLWIYLFLRLCQRKKSFIKIPTLILYLSYEVMNIDFPQIWHFEVKGTGWVGLELSIISTQNVGRFYLWVTRSTGILTLAKLKYFMSKILSAKTLLSCTSANNTRRHSEHRTINIVCKG